MKNLPFLLLLVLLAPGSVLCADALTTMRAPSTHVICENRGKSPYDFEFGVDRSLLVHLPQGCRIDEGHRPRYEPAEFVNFQMTNKSDKGPMMVAVGTPDPEVLAADLLAQWQAKADSVCIFDVVEAPVVQPGFPQMGKDMSPVSIHVAQTAIGYIHCR